MTDLFTHVRVLASEIGPRGTGSTGEAAAADYVAGYLDSLCLNIKRNTFRAVSSQNAFPISIDLIALLAIIVYPLKIPFTPWIAAGLALCAAPLLWIAIIHSESPLRFLLPQVTSRNVLAQIEPQNELHQRVVILAHLDTNRCRLAWQSATVQRLEPLTWLTLAILGSLGLIYLTGAFLGGSLILYWISFIPGIYILGTILTLYRDEKTPFSPGAHDNAASVGVALEIAQRLSKEPLDHTQIWLAFTGAEETDHKGLKVILSEYEAELKQAVFLDLEGVGSGDIVYLTRQGLCKHYHPDPDLLKMVEQTAVSHAELNIKGAQMLMEDEVRTLRNSKFRAICIAGRDPQTGSLPHWHRSDDTIDTISTETMERATKFVIALLKEIDGS